MDFREEEDTRPFVWPSSLRRVVLPLTRLLPLSSFSEPRRSPTRNLRSRNLILRRRTRSRNLGSSNSSRDDHAWTLRKTRRALLNANSDFRFFLYEHYHEPSYHPLLLAPLSPVGLSTLPSWTYGLALRLPHSLVFLLRTFLGLLDFLSLFSRTRLGLRTLFNPPLHIQRP